MEFKRIGTEPKRSDVVMIHLCVVPKCLPFPVKGPKNESPNNANSKRPKNPGMNLFR
jgi:hypothetical protein